MSRPVRGVDPVAGPTLIEQSPAKVETFALAAHEMAMDLQSKNAYLQLAYERATYERDEARGDLDAANARLAELEPLVPLVAECARRLAVHGEWPL